MTKFHVTVKGAIPTGAVIDAADDTDARAQMCENLLDWAEQVELDCEPMPEPEAP